MVKNIDQGTTIEQSPMYFNTSNTSVLIQS